MNNKDVPYLAYADLFRLWIDRRNQPRLIAKVLKALAFLQAIIHNRLHSERDNILT
jgi:hypothetical protein